jgi:hypothetical protein
MRSQTTSFYMRLGSLALLQFSLLCLPASAGVLEGHVEQSDAHAVATSLKAEISDSFPTTYVGTWHCVTTVTDSALQLVAPGTVTECDIEFKRNPQGKVAVHWTQPGWTEAQSSVSCFTTTEARLDRTAYYWADGAGGAWAARSQDNFTITSEKVMISNSSVDQYLDGLYLGRYRTSSVLTKADTPPTTAMLEQH